ncbi:prolyl oligopeptidase family serine peptidase [Arenibacter sp. ARW7G5Y1]|uniref:prolyl oligopeptidase family serine peptidase n=1 Tax=Arenibacter sp. ARW7G5Y1 TaxID=2135619 RepID=UPI000D75E2FE|nr:prolyl oligopeptidase family serine peptidase [Arenibacter sp. ARW7G5Y1]PXX21843.1 prolyl oligopeptidase family protein [Arenibacter sp. ARW7G5Y1]
MKIKILSIGFILTSCFAMSQKVQVKNEASTWKGFIKEKLLIEGKNAYIVKPKKAIVGNPWLWRARFPNYQTVADSILVSEGFHLVYINTNNEYGGPTAMRAWDNLYDYITQEYKLSKKVALVGVSRGGLFIYSWAKRNPEKVACIYADSPVCDFKSWPMGQNGKHSINDWNRLKKVYGFNSDEEAMAYTNNPIDNLEALAKAKVPILHMIGLQDKTVPYKENTMILVKRYIELGGTATVVACSQSKEGSNGHHIILESPQYVANFIKYHSLQDAPSNALNYHNMGVGQQNSRLRFDINKQGHIAFLGDSITHDGGWRNSLMTYFNQHFPDTKFEFILSGIPYIGK